MPELILARQRQIVGTSGEWAADDLVLGAGELALERQPDGSVRAKVGNGSLPFSEAPYLSGGASGLIYRGEIDPTGAPPAGAEPGDLYSARPAGVVAPGWGEPAAGEALEVGDLLALDAGGSWNVIPGTIDVSGLVEAGDLAGAPGAGMVGFSHAITYPAGTIGAHARGRVNVKDAPFGAIGDGVADDTAAFLAAFATGAPVEAPPGTYKVGTLDIPGGHGFHFTGAGRRRTILLAAAANQPILRKVIAPGACEEPRIGGFSLKAHPSGSTGPAFNCSGFRDGTIFDVDGLSNGSAGFNALFDVSADPYLTYGVVWDKCGLSGQTGFAHVWRFHNNGSGSGGNANACEIRAPWVYANTGLTFGIDAARSAQLSVNGGLFEVNSGATAIRWGSTMQIRGVWFELNGQHLAPGMLPDGVGNGSFVTGCVFSDPKTINFGGSGGAAANIWINNTEFGAQTWVGNALGNVKANAIFPPSAPPTAAVTGGQPGALSVVNAVLIDEPNLASTFSYYLRWRWNPAAAVGATQLMLSWPSGFEIVSFSASGINENTGAPVLVAAGLNDIWTSNPVVTDIAIIAYLTLRSSVSSVFADMPPLITALREEALRLLPDLEAPTATAKARKRSNPDA